MCRRACALMDAADILPRNLLFMHRRRQSVAHFRGLVSLPAAVRARRALGGYGHGLPAAVRLCEPGRVRVAGRAVPQQRGARAAGRAIALAHWLASCCEHPNRMLPYDNLRTRLSKLKRRIEGQGPRARALGRHRALRAHAAPRATSATWSTRCRAGISIRCRSRIIACCSRAQRRAACVDVQRQPRRASLESAHRGGRGARQERALSGGLAVRAAVGALYRAKRRAGLRRAVRIAA